MDNTQSETTKKTITILIIEDEQTLSSAIQTKVENAGMKTTIARTGTEGVTFALRDHPDLILLDIVLPELDGLSVLKQIRSDNWGRSVPVIILSNLTQVEAIEESKEQGVSNFLIKTDWKLDDVIKKIKETLTIT